MRRSACALSALCALATVVGSADAQMRLGGHVAKVASLDQLSSLEGDFGVGGRVGVEFPLLPIGVYGSVTHYFPENSYWTGSVFGKVGLPIPFVSPYGILGVQRKTWQIVAEGQSPSVTEFFVGLGLEVGPVFFEGSVNLSKDEPRLPSVDTDLLNFKGGFVIGK